MAAAAALYAHFFCQGADHCHGLPDFQGQNAVILQQYGAFLCALYRQAVMVGDVVGLLPFAVLHRIGVCQLCYPVSGGFNGCRVDLARCQVPAQQLFVYAPTVRHFQIHTRLQSAGQVCAGAPVGDDGAVKAPFPAENIRQQRPVFTGVSAV